jgi:hypothetical protein
MVNMGIAVLIGRAFQDWHKEDPPPRWFQPEPLVPAWVLVLPFLALLIWLGVGIGRELLEKIEENKDKTK